MEIGNQALHEGDRLIIQYDRCLRIVNLDQLPRGAGAPYLEVLPSADLDGQQVYIAKRWAKKTKPNGAFIRFSARQ